MARTLDAFQNSKVRHGTQSGWRLHLHRGERPCDPCYQAKAEYDKRRRNTTVGTLKNRAWALAQSRAYRRLAHTYPNQYAEFYAIEKIRAFEEAGLSEFETDGYGQSRRTETS